MHVAPNPNAALLPSAMTPEAQKDLALRKAAQDFEASFLAEMLKPMGAGAGRTTFGGGAGEAQFGSFLVQEQAKAMAQSGGIGLAQSIFAALKAREEAGSGQ